MIPSTKSPFILIFTGVKVCHVSVLKDAWMAHPFLSRHDSLLKDKDLGDLIHSSLPVDAQLTSPAPESDVSVANEASKSTPPQSVISNSSAEPISATIDPLVQHPEIETLTTGQSESSAAHQNLITSPKGGNNDAVADLQTQELSSPKMQLVIVRTKRDTHEDDRQGETAWRDGDAKSARRPGDVDRAIENVGRPLGKSEEESKVGDEGLPSNKMNLTHKMVEILPGEQITLPEGRCFCINQEVLCPRLGGSLLSILHHLSFC
ncbi:unnamed protein product [Protopolystoma xenopodis]|uniref:Uncharacterized protein n=1 Tax=Protopolystoma xenopodis TaxID=117903 RepID=A0A3S5FBR9_9PLAT|nr:unnamed protein product [Protopolystoma xenopodis]